MRLAVWLLVPIDNFDRFNNPRLARLPARIPRLDSSLGPTSGRRPRLCRHPRQGSACGAEASPTTRDQLEQSSSARQGATWRFRGPRCQTVLNRSITFGPHCDGTHCWRFITKQTWLAGEEKAFFAKRNALYTWRLLRHRRAAKLLKQSSKGSRQASLQLC